MSLTAALVICAVILTALVIKHRVNVWKKHTSTENTTEEGEPPTIKYYEEIDDINVSENAAYAQVEQ